MATRGRWVIHYTSLWLSLSLSSPFNLFMAQTIRRPLFREPIHIRVHEWPNGLPSKFLSCALIYFRAINHLAIKFH